MQPQRTSTGPVTARALLILEAFTPAQRTLTLTEIAHRTSVPLTTAHRLVTELTAWGALERNDSGRYQIGLRLWEIASLSPRGLGLREVALPFMEDLSRVTQENVQLALREGTESVFVERIAGRKAVPVLTRVGGRFPLYPTGVGRVLLAYAPTEIQEQVLTGPMTAFTEKTITSPRELRRLLADVRRKGFAVNNRQVSMDSISVAAPVRGADGTVMAAVSIVVHAHNAEPNALAPVVRAAAQGISRTLGAVPSARSW